MGAFDYKEKQRKVTGLLNGGASTLVYANTGAAANCASVSVGTLSAGVLKKVLSISGKGRINFLMALENGVGPYNNQVKVTLDGVEIFNKTSSVSGNYGIIAVGYGIGSATSGDFLAMHQPIQFESSLLVEIASSSASSSQVLYYNAETHA
jgi:hypothetical protein